MAFMVSHMDVANKIVPDDFVGHSATSPYTYTESTLHLIMHKAPQDNSMFLQDKAC